MATVLELIIVDVKEGVTTDDATFKKLREGAAKGGLKHQSCGFSIEHPNTLYWALYFENGFEQKDFKWPEAEFGNFAEELKTISTSDLTRYFFTFPSFPHAVTAAPVTETAIITLKAGVDMAQFRGVQDDLIANLKQAPSVHGATYAVSTEAGASPVVLLVVGWDSVEAHRAIGALPESQAVVASLHAFIAKIDLVHISFTNEG